MSTSGGVERGVPVVIMLPSIGPPYTLTGSHKLVKEKFNSTNFSKGKIQSKSE